jgi:hypothetical protein
MTSLAVLGLEVRSDQVRQADASLEDLAESATRAEGASQRLAVAQDNLENEARQTTQAVKAQVTAQKMLSATSGAAAFRQRQLAVQSLDVAQSLALGMPPMMVAIQQGGQIAGLYAGQGGVAGAFKEAASSVLGFARANPVALAATAALGVAAFGLRNEINAASDATVGFGHIFTAALQEMAAGIMSVAGPAISGLGTLFAAVSNGILEGIKLVGNSIINTFDFAYQAVVAIWNNLPNALGDLAFQAVQGIANIINPMLQRLGMDAIEIGNPFAGGAGGMAAAMVEAHGTFNNDRVGDFIGRLSERAIELASNGDEAASAIGRVGREAQSAGAPMGMLGQSVQAANDNFEEAKGIFSGFFQDFSQQIQQGASVWDAFKSAGLNALNQITSKLIDMATNNLFGSLFGGLGGGLHMGGIGGAFGGFFADGGTLGAGKWGIAGERGPEIIRGPATVQPMSGSNVSMNVTINNPTQDSIPGIKRALAETRAELMSFQKNAAAVVSGQRRLNPGLA